ncbi:MAG: hypothetical protein IJ259_07255 [Oscillospiraceae bacterium]|nr:hypothetical protein [Oscillospiraceae bacterium]
MKRVDISNRKFGKLTAIRPTDARFAGSVVWQCRCDCGKACEVSYNELASGNKKSCGCLLREHSQPPNHYVDGTCVENIQSQKIRTDNTSGYTGVQRSKNGKWFATITFQKKTYRLGTFERKEDAVAARKQAEDRLFGEFLDGYYNASE